MKTAARTYESLQPPDGRPERHRTTVLLPRALLSAAQQELGSTSATDTIIRALRELVDRRRVERLVEMDLPDLTPDAVERLRKSWRQFAD